MAERRMFAKTIIDSDAFLDMGASAQALYFHLAMRADDDGFINNPRKIQRMICAADDDLKILLAKRFIIGFASGVIVIKHWKIHNYIQRDRYKETLYQEEKALLVTKDNRVYTEKGREINDVSILDTVCIQDVSSLDTQSSLGKVSLGKVSRVEGAKAPARPTIDEVKSYCQERKNAVDAQRWYDHYSSNGWMVGKNKMKDWKASVRTWEKNGYDTPGRPSKEVGAHRYDQRTYTENELDAGVDDLVAEALRMRETQT